MENAQCGEDQNKRIQFWCSVITERLRTLKGHVINFKCVTALFTKQHAYTLQKFFRFLPRFSHKAPLKMNQVVSWRAKIVLVADISVEFQLWSLSWNARTTYQVIWSITTYPAKSSSTIPDFVSFRSFRPQNWKQLFQHVLNFGTLWENTENAVKAHVSIWI